MGCKGGLCVQLSTLPSQCADFLVIWEHQTTETLRAYPELYRGCFIFYNRKQICQIPKIVTFCYVSLSNRDDSLTRQYVHTQSEYIRVEGRGKTNFMQGWYNPPCDEYVFVITLDNEAITDLCYYTKKVYAPGSIVIVDECKI